ncbi:MAG: hypothetical protein EBT57_02230 [Verrucomicrobia bacterium]|nr:hypothetical protein [Verrucomicrobiota bacterium]
MPLAIRPILLIQNSLFRLRPTPLFPLSWALWVGPAGINLRTPSISPQVGPAYPRPSNQDRIARLCQATVLRRHSLTSGCWGILPISFSQCSFSPEKISALRASTPLSSLP